MDAMDSSLLFGGRRCSNGPADLRAELARIVGVARADEVQLADWQVARLAVGGNPGPQIAIGVFEVVVTADVRDDCDLGDGQLADGDASGAGRGCQKRC